ncbi:zinc dependent phospholipase C family protein [Sphingobacterium bovistauri]|uniref:Zinc dependent phospholipase C family protein n=1 Tax=Sphingobacterium bovistauri TaxID=2781959 RepID=A0ABS7Z4S7_9SPHI|nr:zinc dependent phospholipase C family protein [Sphingobacterium bovistauri]MCA5005152.1 zinc dependent phospholipase C family protein [Sphingobacterium bovistauri]
MPGPAVHYIIGQQLRNRISKSDSRYVNSEYYFDHSIISALNNYPTYLNVGTLGPDFLFFNIKDWPIVGEYLPVKEIIAGAKYLKMLENELERIFPVFGKIHEAKVIIEDEINKVGEGIIQSSPTLTRINQLINDIKAIIAVMKAIVTNGLKDLVSSNVNIFGLVTHPIQSCDKDYEKWWWFDILHYRRSGDFAKYLVQNAKDERLKAYSIGYLSHVTADTVGHPYVNNIVRGPFRTHGQRHKVVENFQDVNAFKTFYSKEFVTSGLCEEFTFKDAESLKRAASHQVPSEVQSIIDGLTPSFADKAMPEDLAALIAKASNEVYQENGKHIFGGGMSAEEVDTAYRLWLSWFTATTTETLLPKELPGMPTLSEDIRRIWEAFKEKMGQAYDALKDALSDITSSGFDFSFKGLANFLEKVGKAIQAAIAFATAIVQLLEEMLLLLPSQAVHYVLNQIYQALYVVYDYFRMSIALSGITFPTISHTKDPRVSHMLHPSIADGNNNQLQANWPYPAQGINFGTGLFRHLKQSAHLVYPPNYPESTTTVAAPSSYSLNGHNYFINKGIAMNDRELMQLALDPNYGMNNQQNFVHETLGNALVLTSKYYNLIEKGYAIPNLNLDADRGFAFSSWEGGACANKKLVMPVNVSVKK